MQKNYIGAQKKSWPKLYFGRNTIKASGCDKVKLRTRGVYSI